jgi:hypothetical protein
MLSYNIHSYGRSESSPIDYSPTVDIDTLINMAGRLRPSLPANCLWLGEGDLEVVGVPPIDAGGFADAWAGEMGDRIGRDQVLQMPHICRLRADLRGE